jgi:hypothetical protein
MQARRLAHVVSVPVEPAAVNSLREECHKIFI